MKEATKDRISRLLTRKGELLDEMKALRAASVRNVEHKLAMLNDQVMRIGERINKLKGVNNGKQG